MAPSLASARTTGSTRRASSSGLTGVKPGRHVDVDSPPTSMMSAPASSIARPYSIAASWSKCSPPSLNESGVEDAHDTRTVKAELVLSAPPCLAVVRHEHPPKMPASPRSGTGGGVALQSVFPLYPRTRARMQTRPRCRKKSAGRHLHPDRWAPNCKWPAHRQ